MNSVILASPVMMVLLAGALLLALLCRFGRRKLLWAIASALCAIGAILAGLVLAVSLQQILLALLLPAAVSFSALGSREGGGHDEL